MITLHHLEQSRSSRIAWLLEELNLDYEIVTYYRDPKTFAAPETLKSVHPLGKSPVITDGEVTIAESGAIIDYLIERYDVESVLKPQQEKTLLDYRYWLHFAEGSLMPLLVMRLVLAKSLEKSLPFFIKPIINKYVDALNLYFISPRLTPQLHLINDYLAEHAWFAGDECSGADIQMMLPLQLAKTRCDLTPYTHIQRYMAQVEARPAFQKANRKLG